MNKKVKKKNPLKLKACAVALSLWGLSAVLALSSSPVMAAETASNVAQEQVARALVNKGVNLDNLNRYEEAIAAYNDLITRFGNSQDPKIQGDVAIALFGKGNDLGNLHRYEEALAAYNDVITRFGNSQDPKIQKAMAMALFNKGVYLAELHRYKEAIAAFNDVITRFSNLNNPIIKYLITRFSLVNDDGSFNSNNDMIGPIINYFITRFGKLHDPMIQETVAKALFSKGVDLGRLGRIEQTRSVWKELVSYFWTSKDRDIQVITLQAQYRLPMLNMISN